MSIGLLVGMAALFFLPLILFLPIILLILLIFTNTLSRRYAILIISAAMPFAVALAYYWVLHGETVFFYSHFILPTFDLGLDLLLFSRESLVVYLPLLLLFIAGYVTMPKQRRLNNYQNRLAQLFFITAILLLGIPFVAKLKHYALALIYLPVLTFIATHLFYLIRRPVTDLLVSLLFLGTVLFMSYQVEFKITGWPLKTHQTAAATPELIDLIEGKKIWVLGRHQELYTYGSIGTTFFDWQLSRPYLDNLNYYDNLVFIQESIDLYQPDIILDYEFRWRQIVKHIPTLENNYEKVRPFVWQRKQD
jgi:hypothetical protein